jgi:hypothetical protein
VCARILQHLAQQLQAKLPGDGGAPASPKDVVHVAASRAVVVRHVFNQAKQWHPHFSKHLCAAPVSHQVQVVDNPKGHALCVLMCLGPMTGVSYVTCRAMPCIRTVRQ